MKKRSCRTIAAALLLVLTASAGQAEMPSMISKITLAGHFGIFSMDGTGSATPGAWDEGTGHISIDVLDDLSRSLVSQSPAYEMGFGWDSRSLVVFGLTLGYQLNDRIHLRLDSEWAYKRVEPNLYNDVAPSEAHVYPPPRPGYEYVDPKESNWTQGTMMVALDYIPFASKPNWYLTGGLEYTQFQCEMVFNHYTYSYDEPNEYDSTYDDTGASLGYMLGTGLLFSRKPGKQEAFIEATYSWMTYGNDLSFSGNKTLFNRKVNMNIGGLRLTTGIRFFVANLFTSE